MTDDWNTRNECQHEAAEHYENQTDSSGTIVLISFYSWILIISFSIFSVNWLKTLNFTSKISS